MFGSLSRVSHLCCKTKCTLMPRNVVMKILWNCYTTKEIDRALLAEIAIFIFLYGENGPCSVTEIYLQSNKHIENVSIRFHCSDWCKFDLSLQYPCIFVSKFILLFCHRCYNRIRWEDCSINQILLLKGYP